MKKYSVNELRKMFLDFFKSKEHLVMNSFSLIPKNDNSLLLINSGMAPLKPYFTGMEIPPKTRVATCQKCIRTGDIDNVGKTARHGTYFEMLGNFSFGDYFKREAIHWSWEFLTEVVGLDKDRLYPSVYEEDDEAFEIWNKEMGIDANRIFKMGKADNFWEHGAGPCGPCSEIYYDRGEKYGCDDPNCTVGCECDRYMEVWNNVFTQFENDGNGNYSTLKKKNIDTGMGLERLAVVVQDVDSIFDVDTIQSVVNKVCSLAGTSYHRDEKEDISIRLITDHIRSATFLIGDGVLPSNEGRGYVLRRLIRRAARHGNMLGIPSPFLSKLSAVVVETSKSGYPELDERKEAIFSAITAEEEQFAKTLSQGMDMLKDMIKGITPDEDNKLISGDKIFKLYDTYGFPIDIAKDYLEEKGFVVDEEGFHRAMQEQKQKARNARSASNYMGAENTVYDELPNDLTTDFVGYTTLNHKSKVVALTTVDEVVDSLEKDMQGTIFVEETPFYATGGGQMHDIGYISGDNFKFEVVDVEKLRGGKIAHIGKVIEGKISLGDTVDLEVNKTRRVDTEANHSATHLLNKALRIVLGKHVSQAGSLVDEHKLRFDFTHYDAMTKEEIARVEELVNEDIRNLNESYVNNMAIEDAKNMGAMALFGEKYGDVVRVVKMGESIELCGGTHVKNTGVIGAFKIVSEAGVSAGVRRIEAVTGHGLMSYINSKLELIDNIAVELKTSESNIISRISQLSDELKEQRKENEVLKAKMAKDSLGEIEVQKIGDVGFIAKRLDDIDINALRNLGDDIKSKNPNSVILLAGVYEGRVTILCMVDDKVVKLGVKAGDIIKNIAPLIDGKGGGRPNMAQGGGSNVDGIAAALEKAYSLAKDILNN